MKEDQSQEAQEVQNHLLEFQKNKRMRDLLLECPKGLGDQDSSKSQNELQW